MTAIPNPVTGAANGQPPAGDPAGPGAPGNGEAPWRQRDSRRGYAGDRLYRSTTDRVWAGVCGGLAEHFGWEPSVTRVGYAILTLFTGIFPMLVLYIVMAMVLPNGSASAASAAAPGWQTGTYSGVRPIGSGVAAMVFGVLLIVGGAVALVEQYALVDTRLIGPFVAVGLGLLLVAASLVRRP